MGGQKLIPLLVRALHARLFAGYAHLLFTQLFEEHCAALLHFAFDAFLALHFFCLRLQNPLVHVWSAVAIFAAGLLNVNGGLFVLHPPPLGLLAYMLVMLKHKLAIKRYFLNIFSSPKCILV